MLKFKRAILAVFIAGGIFVGTFGTTAAGNNMDCSTPAGGILLKNDANLANIIDSQSERTLIPHPQHMGI